MKFFSRIPAVGRILFEPAEPEFAGDEDWRRDPIAHPVLAAMSPRELADLPFDRCYRLPRGFAEG
ncbi:hypothetical protein [Kumtagia ephedrae]|uniref:Uncharacterized protein n=1 Tax=Kumtagia ephedrae TaxID=2116701 RepID=A0A2P7SJC6_9HYPH|nr:hypothetical protein [Mesorhizobium ephedrae]PSJ62584.1 hypothetical protein C7I84_08255 [Mesorhizobium ephedrae]